MTRLIEMKIIVPEEDKDRLEYVAYAAREDWLLTNFGDDAEFIRWEHVRIGDTISIDGDPPCEVLGAGPSLFEPWLTALSLSGRCKHRAEDDHEVVLINRTEEARMTELVDRYPGVPGVRLDTDADSGQTGPAVDLHNDGKRGFTLWVRESGTDAGKSATVFLSPENLQALRDGASRLLVEGGTETWVTVSVPRTRL